jgi:hypothetical protein
MNFDQDFSKNQLEMEMQAISERVWEIASKHQDDSWTLLSLLRHLEFLHRNIREQLFEPSLPQTRQQLYKLLKEIDEIGGWPYIERMKLQKLLDNLEVPTLIPEQSNEE